MSRRWGSGERPRRTIRTGVMTARADAQRARALRARVLGRRQAAVRRWQLHHRQRRAGPGSRVDTATGKLLPPLQQLGPRPRRLGQHGLRGRCLHQRQRSRTIEDGRDRRREGHPPRLEGHGLRHGHRRRPGLGRGRRRWQVHRPGRPHCLRAPRPWTRAKGSCPSAAGVDTIRDYCVNAAITWPITDDPRCTGTPSTVIEGSFAARASTGALAWIEDGDTYGQARRRSDSANHAQLPAQHRGFPKPTRNTTTPWRSTWSPRQCRRRTRPARRSSAGCRPGAFLLRGSRHWPSVPTPVRTRRPGPSRDGLYAVLGGEFPSVNGKATGAGSLRASSLPANPNKQGPIPLSPDMRLDGGEQTAPGTVPMARWSTSWDRDTLALGYSSATGRLVAPARPFSATFGGPRPSSSWTRTSRRARTPTRRAAICCRVST